LFKHDYDSKITGQVSTYHCFVGRNIHFGSTQHLRYTNLT